MLKGGSLNGVVLIKRLTSLLPLQMIALAEAVSKPPLGHCGLQGAEGDSLVGCSH